jgi:hypothetical protein
MPAGDVPTRAVEPRDEAAGDRVGQGRKDDNFKVLPTLSHAAQVLRTLL